MTARCSVVVGLFALAFAASAADPPWYVKKTTWEETLQASRGAFEKHLVQARKTATLPDFGRDNWTVTAWIRTTRGGTILAKAPATGNWAPQGKTLFVRRGRLAYDVGWVGSLQSQRNVADGKWHHVALTKKGQTLRMFVDGREDTTGKLKTGPDVASHVVKIGFTTPDFPRSGSAFVGDLDDVRIYRRALSADDLRAHLEKVQPTQAAGLAACWPFDAGLRDASGHGSDATAVGQIATTPGKFGKALRLSGRAHAVIRGKRGELDRIWALLERDFGRKITPLFDGVSLNGWRRRNEPGHGSGAVWAVSDGAIDGVQEWPGSWGMLATRRAFGDFELRLEIKTEWPIDTAILLRETRGGNAYQVTIHCRDDGDVGGIAAHKFADFHVKAEGWKKCWKKDDWNKLRVVIQHNPPTIRTWLNGQAMADYRNEAKEKRLPDRGPIAIKIHGADDAFSNHVYFRNLHVLTLK